MPNATRKTSSGKKSVTLCDVVLHMQGMEKRLTKRIDGTDARLDALGSRVGHLSTRLDTVEKKLTLRMDRLEENLTGRMDALEEDLTATMKDTVKIRRHVGMTMPIDE